MKSRSRNALLKAEENILSMAAQADPFELYEASVQDPHFECEFLQTKFFEIRGRKPFLLREDFCSTAYLCREWIKQGDLYRAIGVDIDPKPLKWCKSQAETLLSPCQRARLMLIEEDVVNVSEPTVDLIYAGNFSYWLFLTRTNLVNYFKSALKSLTNDGILFLDAFGGHEAFKTGIERRRRKGFSYIFEQSNINPISQTMDCSIHFKFPDGSCLNHVYKYQFRIWALPEIRESIIDAGFSDVLFFWENEDDEGNGTGNYSVSEKGSNDPVWVAMIAAIK